MRNQIAHRIIHEKCGGVKNYAEITGQNELSARNHLRRGFPGSVAHNEIYTRLREAGVDVSTDDFFTQSNQPKKGKDHDQKGQ